MIMAEQRRVVSVPEFLEMVKKQRDSKDLRLLHIEQRVGVSRGTVRRLINVGRCSVSTLETLAQYYGAEVAIVFKHHKKKGMGIPED